MTHYVGIADHDEGSLWGIYFPDLPGCYSAGETQDELVRMSIEAVQLWAESTIAAGRPLPEARTIDQLRKDRDIATALANGSFAVLVPLIYETGRNVRANISLDSGLLDAIDAAARKSGLTRSAFLMSAAREKIAASA